MKQAQETQLVPLFSSIEYIQRHWKRFLTIGILLVLVGTIAIGAATVTSLVTVIFIACILLVGGIAKLIYSFWARQWSGFFLSLLVGLLYTLAGALFLAKPIPALAALTLLIGSLFIVSGAFKIIVALTQRFDQWGWILFSGIIGVLLGSLVLAEWPAASLWVIGLFVGIDLIIYGWTCILLALTAKPQNPKR